MKRELRQETFDRWLTEHKSLVFKIVCACAVQSSDQDDLFQEIAYQLWKSLPSFRGDSKETTWIYKVALNTSLAWSRKENNRRARTAPLSGVEPTLTRAEGANDERLQWLYEQIALLDEIERSLTLLMLDGFSYREMSEILGITESHVGVKLTRIRKHLANQLEKEQNDEL